MSVLEKILKDKYKEVALKKTVINNAQFEASKLFEKEVNSLVKKLRHGNSGIIAEYKRRSPSKAVINQDLNVAQVARAYEAAGVSGMSVLTDTKYFGGALDDLLLARSGCALPLLRKDFIVDEFQILEARANGADVILLIAAALDKARIKELSEFAKSLNMEVLLEVHNAEELERSVMPSLDMLGVNNRNLKTFEVSLGTSLELAARIPEDFVKISESGISKPASIRELKAAGYQGFLIGENFMRTPDPGAAASEFIKELLR